MTRLSYVRLMKPLRMMFVLTALPLLLPAMATAQRKPVEEVGPVFREYRGVQLGMTTEEARKKLGNPKEKSDGQDFYEFSDNETAQIVYDAAHKVVTVSIDFLKGAKDIPTAKSVVGAEIEAKPDGSMHKMVRYEKAGCWVSYSRTSGDSPLISITLQKN
jgi:hypothetical protein